jgi:ornithine decarboxylase
MPNREYTEFGIPATILAHYLRENGIVPEKCDLNSILFLLTPAESSEKLAQLVAMLGQFEQHIEDDTAGGRAADHLTRNTRCAIAITPSASCARRCTISTSALT